MNGNMTMFFGLLAALVLPACVGTPDAKSGGTLWDQYVDELTPPDKDTVVVDTATVGDDDLLESPDADAFVCLGAACTTHADCKKPSCVATFCSTVLGTLAPNNPNACAMRCDPVNSGAECPDGMTCNDQIQQAAGLGIDIDGAKGICAPPTRR